MSDRTFELSFLQVLSAMGRVNILGELIGEPAEKL
jgi:hypothetical protein